MSIVGEFQFRTLKAIQVLGADAYGMRIRDLLESNDGREIHMPQVYAALSRLSHLGLAESGLDEENSSGRKGRTRRVYKLSADGLKFVSGEYRYPRMSVERLLNASPEAALTA